MRRVLALALTANMACASVPPDVPPSEGDSGYRCDSSRLGDLVGRAPTEALGEEALRRSGSRSLRWIRPGDAVTMDYRPDRLNIHLDGRNRVERFACG